MFRDYDLLTLLKAHPLPKGVQDLVCNLSELARGLDKSEVMVARYRDGGMPVLTKGGAGKAYEFQLAHCWAWYHGMKAGEAALLDDRTAQLELLRMALVGEDGSNDMLKLTPKQRSAEYEAARRYSETAMAQGKLAYRSEMVLLLEGVFSVVRNQLVGLPDVMERRVGLSPEQSEAMEKIAKETVGAIATKLNDSNLVINIAAKAKLSERKATG